jgi:hypothetical protein
MIMTTLQFLMLCRQGEATAGPEESCCKAKCILCYDDSPGEQTSNDGKDYYDYEDRCWVYREGREESRTDEREGLERPEVDRDRGRPD